jgi:hypothetical protein
MVAAETRTDIARPRGRRIGIHRGKYYTAVLNNSSVPPPDRDASSRKKIVTAHPTGMPSTNDMHTVVFRGQNLLSAFRGPVLHWTNFDIALRSVPITGRSRPWMRPPAKPATALEDAVGWGDGAFGPHLGGHPGAKVLPNKWPKCDGTGAHDGAAHFDIATHRRKRNTTEQKGNGGRRTTKYQTMQCPE